jgi:hypothetical protein
MLWHRRGWGRPTGAPSIRGFWGLAALDPSHTSLVLKLFYVNLATCRILRHGDEPGSGVIA